MYVYLGVCALFKLSVSWPKAIHDYFNYHFCCRAQQILDISQKHTLFWPWHIVEAWYWKAHGDSTCELLVPFVKVGYTPDSFSMEPSMKMYPSLPHTLFLLCIHTTLFFFSLFPLWMCQLSTSSEVQVWLLNSLTKHKPISKFSEVTWTSLHVLDRLSGDPKGECCLWLTSLLSHVYTV